VTLLSGDDTIVCIYSETQVIRSGESAVFICHE